jgi:biopolymer transport protein ExbD
MKRASPYLDRGSEVDMDSAMTPMIDVVFLLLVFFVWTASFVAIEQVLPSELSSQLGEQPDETMTPPIESDLDQVVVRIGWNETQPTWAINQQTYSDLKTVDLKLQRLASAASATPIILHPQSNVPLGHVIETYDVAKRCRFEKISFAVNP